MIIVNIIGGLGNQMFQYATGLSLAMSKNTSLKLDTSGFDKYDLHNYSLDNFAISSVKATKLEIFLLKLRKIILLKDSEFIESKFNFNEDLFDQENPVYLRGYWQSEKYFKSIRDKLVIEFLPKNPISSYSQGILEKIRSSNCSISLHVRRGDYLLTQNQKIHGVCSLKYYESAITFMEKSFEHPTFFVFSDDIEWAKNNLIFNSSVVWVDGNDSSRNFEDIYLMSCCMHNVIANSSFSWWGAWLNSNANKKVIAPKAWFQTPKHDISDLYCSNWILL